LSFWMVLGVLLCLLGLLVVVLRLLMMLLMLMLLILLLLLRMLLLRLIRIRIELWKRWLRRRCLLGSLRLLVCMLLIRLRIPLRVGLLIRAGVCLLIRLLAGILRVWLLPRLLGMLCLLVRLLMYLGRCFGLGLRLLSKAVLKRWLLRGCFLKRLCLLVYRCRGR